MKFCCGLFQLPIDEYVPVARAAEAAGFDTVVVSDHVVHPERIGTPYPYSEDGARTWSGADDYPDAWVATAMMAAATTRLRFLQAIFVLPLRDPFTVAKALGTLAHMSGYRVGLGAGVGWSRDEFEILGARFESRGARCDEMLAVMRKLWTGERVEHRGRFYSFPTLQMSPGVRGPIPVIVGGSSDAALRRAAAHADGWFPPVIVATPEHFTAHLARLRAYRREAGRADRDFAIYWTHAGARDADAFRRLEDLGATHAITMPWLLYGGGRTAAARREGLARFADDVIAKLA